MVYRRREIDLQNDIEHVVKSKGKGVLGWLIKSILAALVKDILEMLKSKSWVVIEDEEDLV